MEMSAYKTKDNPVITICIGAGDDSGLWAVNLQLMSFVNSIRLL